ncbi:hypothetical protein TCAL_00743 [Tigriopus californicus]|uniref:Uncharacterized protein n=1 Tax=Tigriopus californicus TaxID=6832 RepID=A0A553PCC9_TIGCA|nr:hypothetical protein TCAL_00743 [Tigriopus californicus]
MTYSVPSYLEETRSQTEDLIQQSQTSDFNLEILAQEWLSAVQVRQDRLTQELADLYAQFVGHVDQIRTIKDYQEEKSKLAMSELERHQTELSQLNVVKDEKGFAINPIKNDVSTFVLDQRELTDSRNHNILWDYIGAGVSSEWKRL